MEKKLNMVKEGVSIVVSIGVGILAGNAISLYKPKNLNVLKKVAVKVGSVVMVDLISVKAVEHFEGQWDECLTKLREFFTKEETD